MRVLLCMVVNLFVSVSVYLCVGCLIGCVVCMCGCAALFVGWAVGWFVF